MATAKGSFVNLHLIVSPEDPDHVAELQRLLSRLHFTVQQDRFDCTRAELIRLGKKADPTIVDAILLEQNDEWAVSRRYMTLESIAPLSDGVPITLPTVAA